MRILVLTFYFSPDLCAGSFRNTSLVNELTDRLGPTDVVHVITTQPNRYRSFSVTAPNHEVRAAGRAGLLQIDRIPVPPHASGLADQARSFWTYYRAAHRLAADQHYDLVVASSSRLFTAFLGARLTRRRRVALVLDIRDLFRETILELFRNKIWQFALNLVLKAVERYTFGYATHINLVSKGFQSYFHSFSNATYSYFTNGVDEEFLNFRSLAGTATGGIPKIILYAGNIGEGQGLHKIIPQAARRLGNQYRFIVIGDGGAKAKLAALIRSEKLTNVELRNPVSRNALVAEYHKADYLFVHLNDLEAFRRVLPSKLFDYGATDKPILAGVAGYAARFVQKYIANAILFAPCDVEGLITQLHKTPYQTLYRADFVARFRRKTNMGAMAQQILDRVSLRNAHPETAAS